MFVAKTLAGLPNEHEWTYVLRDGTHFSVLLSITALRDSAGQTTGYLGIAVDITDRTRKEQELSDSEIKYRQLFKILDPFFTTHLSQGGSGLGLHICYNLVTGVLGGKLGVSTEPGHGTTFNIQMPRLAQYPTHGDAPATTSLRT